jgi:integrase
MLIKEILAQYIKTRPLRQSSKESYERTFKVLGLLDLDVSEVNIDLLYERINKIPNHNTRRTHTIVLRSVLGQIEGIKLLRISATQPKYWDLPDETTLRTAVEQSRWWKILYLCMYAGLRVGEACAIRPTDLKGNEFSLIQLMVTDTVFLPATIIKQRISREQFERDFVNTKVPDDDIEIARTNNNMATRRLLMSNLPSDGKEASTQYFRQQSKKLYYSGQIAPMNIFNPFAWSEFIKAWKRGDYKKK